MKSWTRVVLIYIKNFCLIGFWLEMQNTFMQSSQVAATFVQSDFTSLFSFRFFSETVTGLVRLKC